MNVDNALTEIAFLLLALLLFKDMSGKEELQRIRAELERIADELKRRETHEHKQTPERVDARRD